MLYLAVDIPIQFLLPFVFWPTWFWAPSLRGRCRSNIRSSAGGQQSIFVNFQTASESTGSVYDCHISIIQSKLHISTSNPASARELRNLVFMHDRAAQRSTARNWVHAYVCAPHACKCKSRATGAAERRIDDTHRSRLRCRQCGRLHAGTGRVRVSPFVRSRAAHVAVRSFNGSSGRGTKRP